jgi:putative aminophosphonate oxidoreductase
MLSLWEQQTGVPEALHPPLDRDVTADVCIVGGGFLGLWTAIGIRELRPDADVVLVEAGRCGRGAAGRNGGFVLSWWSKFLTLERLCGTEEALRLARMSTDAISGIDAFCRADSIECDLRRGGWIWSATNADQLGSWKATLDRLSALGEEPFAELTAEEAAARTGSRRHLGGVFEASSAIVQPAALVAGLRRAAAEHGVRIYEESPMRSLGKERAVSVVTPEGTVTAPKVVLALSAWTGGVKELERYLIVVASDVVATEPAPEQLAETGWTDGASISDSRMLVHYYRTTLDGRVVFGKGGGCLARGGRAGPLLVASPDRTRIVERELRETYPSLAGVPVSTAWSGPVDRTASGLPFFSRLPGNPDVLAGFGFSGNGVGPSFVGGRILASLALGLDDEWSRAGLVRELTEPFPPEPLRYLGGRAVRAAVARKEAAEDEGRRPDPLTSALARLTPSVRGDY